VKWTNDNGGINGHPVKLIISDDAVNPGTALAQVTKMVEQDHVVTILNGSNVESAWSSYTTDHKIPVIGNGGSSTESFRNPLFFPPGQTIDSLIPSMVSAAKQAGVTKLGMVYCSAAPVCATLADPAKAAAEAQGIEFAFATAIPEQAPNYTAPCLAAKQAGVDGLWIAESSTVAVQFVQSCSAQGYHPKYLAFDGAIAASWLNEPGFEGFVGVEGNLPSFAKDNAAVADMNAALDKYSPGTTTDPNFGPQASGTWASAQLFAAAAKAANVGDNATPAQMITGFHALKDETLGGLSPKLNYVEGQPTSVKCWFYIGIKDKQFTLPYGNDPTCA